MKTWSTSQRFRSPRWAIVALFFITALGVSHASEQWATLEAIHQLENPRNLSRPGPYGELGAYQFRSSTWRMHTTLPFYRANERALSDRVAAKHYDYLKRGLERAGIASTPYNIALAWNGGLQGVVTGKSPRVAHDYAHRAANLTEVFASRQRIASAR